MRYFIIVMLLVSANTQAKDYYLESAIGLHLIDWMQTRHIVVNDSIKESNPILGKNPNMQEVNGYMAITGAAMLIIHKSIPVNYRKTFRMFWAMNNAAFVSNNFMIGVKFKI